MRPIPEERKPRYADEKNIRANSFAVLKLFPSIPARFIPLLWEIALGPSKTRNGRWPRVPDARCPARKRDRCCSPEQAGSTPAWHAALHWLAELKLQASDSDAQKPRWQTRRARLRATNRCVRLRSLGVRLEDLLDVEQLEEDAEKGLKKGVPSGPGVVSVFAASGGSLGRLRQTSLAAHYRMVSHPGLSSKRCRGESTAAALLLAA